MDGPLGVFCEELDELISRWRSKPEDDRLSHAEVVGSLEFLKLKLMREAFEEGAGDELPGS